MQCGGARQGGQGQFNPHSIVAATAPRPTRKAPHAMRGCPPRRARAVQSALDCRGNSAATHAQSPACNAGVPAKAGTGSSIRTRLSRQQRRDPRISCGAFGQLLPLFVQHVMHCCRDCFGCFQHQPVASVGPQLLLRANHAGRPHVACSTSFEALLDSAASFGACDNRVNMIGAHVEREEFPLLLIAYLFNGPTHDPAGFSVQQHLGPFHQVSHGILQHRIRQQLLLSRGGAMSINGPSFITVEPRAIRRKRNQICRLRLHSLAKTPHAMRGCPPRRARAVQSTLDCRGNGAATHAQSPACNAGTPAKGGHGQFNPHSIVAATAPRPPHYMRGF